MYAYESLVDTEWHSQILIKTCSHTNIGSNKFEIKVALVDFTRGLWIGMCHVMLLYHKRVILAGLGY